MVVYASVSEVNDKGHQTEKYPRVVRESGSNGKQSYLQYVCFHYLKRAQIL